MIRPAFFCFVLLLLGCAADPPESTRMTVNDFDDMAQAMAQSLLRSDAIAQRSANSKPWIVVIDKVVNLTDDVMTSDEQWAVMAMLRGATPIVQLRHSKNLRFIIESDAGSLTPTHTMTAVFRSVRRSQHTQRSDLYYCEFELLNLRTREPAWIDKFEFKRAAKGHLWD